MVPEIFWRLQSFNSPVRSLYHSSNFVHQSVLVDTTLGQRYQCTNKCSWFCDGHAAIKRDDRIFEK
ncbi:CBM_collapsed_G0024610.mRNA.1.CDS.1 [Saccharomyces cerevisiae]|nr:CBM_collapsed_G0024610.mRNA.1.CDS.1 [Saccharomyces cerevisiae]